MPSSTTSTIQLNSASADAATAVIIFSSVNSNGFTFYNLMELKPDLAHRIYVRDPYDAWYERGVSEALPSWADLAASIHDLIKSTGATRTVTFGSSMGGYAALRLAQTIPIDSCLALSPQTLLDNRLPHTPKSRFGSDGFDIAATAMARPDCRINVIYGAADFVDIYNVSRVQAPHLALYPVMGKDHLVAQHLSRTRELTSVVDTVLQGDDPIIGDLTSNGSELDERCFNPEVQRLVCQAIERFYLSAPGSAEETLLALNKIGDFADSYNILAKLAYRERRIEEALELSKRATELAPGSVTIQENNASMLKSAGRAEEAIASFQRCLKIRPKHYAALCALGDLLLKAGRRSEGIQYLIEAVAIRPRLDLAHRVASKHGVAL